MACLLGIAAGVVLGLRSFGKRGKSSQLPSGPSPVELFSHLSRSAFVQEKWVQKHGEIFQTWLPFLNIVSIADPDATRDIAVSKGNNYRDPCLFGRHRGASNEKRRRLKSKHGEPRGAWGLGA